MTKTTNQYDSQGNQHGVWKNYWPDGTIMWRAHFLHGEIYRLRKHYYRDGTLYQKVYLISIK